MHSSFCFCLNNSKLWLTWSYAEENRACLYDRLCPADDLHVILDEQNFVIIGISIMTCWVMRCETQFENKTLVQFEMNFETPCSCKNKNFVIT